VLNEGELRHLLAEAQSPTFLAKQRGTVSSLPWFYPALVFAAYTGARRGEVLATRGPISTWTAARLRSVHRSPAALGLAFKRPKNGQVRTVTITSELVAVLRSHKARQAAEQVYLGGKYHRDDLVLRDAPMDGRFLPRPSGRHSSGSSSGQRSRAFDARPPRYSRLALGKGGRADRGRQSTTRS